MKEYEIKLEQIYSCTQDNGKNLILAAKLMQFNGYDDDEDDENKYDENFDESDQSDSNSDDEQEFDEQLLNPFELLDLLGVEVIRCAAHVLALIVDDTLEKLNIKTKMAWIRKLDYCDKYVPAKEKISEAEWEFCRTFLELFKPVKIATKKLQSEQLTLGDFFKVWLKPTLDLKQQAATNQFNVRQAQEHLLSLYKQIKKIEHKSQPAETVVTENNESRESDTLQITDQTLPTPGTGNEDAPMRLRVRSNSKFVESPVPSMSKAVSTESNSIQASSASLPEPSANLDEFINGLYEEDSEQQLGDDDIVAAFGIICKQKVAKVVENVLTATSTHNVNLNIRSDKHDGSDNASIDSNDLSGFISITGNKKLFGAALAKSKRLARIASVFGKKNVTPTTLSELSATTSTAFDFNVESRDACAVSVPQNKAFNSNANPISLSELSASVSVPQNQGFHSNANLNTLSELTAATSTAFDFNVYDEYQHYVDCCHLTATEAYWRMASFPVHYNDHVVYRLPVHLPHYQRVIIDMTDVEQSLARSGSELLAYFKLNQVDEQAREMLYADIPYKYVYDRETKTWRPRQRTPKELVTRLYGVNYNQIELYSLRLLLLTVKGARSYEELRNVNGIQYDTFHAASLALGLLTDDGLQLRTFSEICHVEMPYRIRCLFANLLIFITPHDPLAFWESFKTHMIADYMSENLALRHISNMLTIHGSSNTAMKLPEPVFHNTAQQDQANEIASEYLHNKYDPVEEASIAQRMVPLFNNTGAELRQTDVLLIDEVSLVNKHAFNAVDALYRDLKQKRDEPFGGMVVIAADVTHLTRASRSEIVNNLVKRSNTWPLFEKHALSTNMRLADPNDEALAKWLIDIGDGKIKDCPANQYYDSYVKLPTECVSPASLVDCIYGETFRSSDISNYCQYAILSTHHDDVDMLNRLIYNRMTEEVSTERKYYSTNSMVNEDRSTDRMYEITVLNKLNPKGTAPHELILKENCIIMLLRNLNPFDGFCNGTSLLVKKLYDNCIVAEIISGDNAGKVILIPRIRMTARVESLSDELLRIQFPVKSCFAMTIDKSQSQSFDSVGLFLRKPPFSHGQLYVALSRTRHKANLKIQVYSDALMGKMDRDKDDVYVPNIVYREAL
ncbi:ATP-dependent DNA helicase PIF1 [Pseudolycoriella hygida]|uniref:ATP-dependent DNA helicase n=1 Tax=Pseudolycoriella hygida TaxID=35572 RepID=A0A9Q0N3Y4_9DIPT|nr:ATP-dependent DNA helicase PIF1 [Pseudolycoriella hygida]